MRNHLDHFFETLGRPFAGDELFDAVEDTVFFLKDSLGRYVSVNLPLVRRCGFSSKLELLGKKAAEVFPSELGECIESQDAEVLQSGAPILGRLELHLYRGGAEGWCLTWKQPLRDANGNVVGLSGISRDVPRGPSIESDELSLVSSVLNRIQSHLSTSLNPEELASSIQLSAYQLDRRIDALFGLSTSQYVTRSRIDLARHLLTGSVKSISDIAIDCGYADQSSLTRQFRRSVGVTPNVYRQRFGNDR